MFISIKSIGAYSVHCTDGELGVLEAFHFDDRTWSIRYLVININSLLNPKRVLLLPTAAYELSWSDHSIKVNLNKKQVMNATPYSADLPVSVQHELLDRKNFHTLYLSDPWSGSVLPMWFPNTDKAGELVEVIGDEDLRCTSMTIGYKVMASDKQAGKVVDMILDDHEWKIKYLVVDTNGFLPLGDVLLSVKHVDGFVTDDEIISIDISSDELKHCPKYDSNAPVNRDYVMKYYDYEGRLVGTAEKNVDEYSKLDKGLTN